MLQRAAASSPTWWEISNDRSQIRWNRQLSKSFDVAAEEFPAASVEEGLVSKYLGVAIKHLERRTAQIPSVRMGAFLTAVGQELSTGSPLLGKATGWIIDDIRNLDYKGEETPPVYDVIQLNSTQSGDFLVDGMRFLRQGDERTGVRSTLRVQPRWWGLQVTAYGLRTAGTAQMLLSRIQGLAKEINFLKGEAFSLSGEFLPKTAESFDDLFLEPGNAAAVERIVRLINTKGKSLENRGVLLMGPPGTGKTLSARIVRNEARATFIWVSARDFHYAGSFGGFTEAFDLARECAPSVIVFEDVDNWLYDTTVDLLKTEMDGVARSSGVVTMMTTNYPELLPEALIDRPGRFHDVLKFGLPNADARKQMLLRWLPDVPSADLAKAVESTDGYSGAHIRELARFATIIAEQDGLTVGKALIAALAKLAEQRDLITSTQRGQSYYRGLPTELIGKGGVRLPREVACSQKTFDERHKAWAGLTVKSLDEERRIITGMATTPTPDRVGDIIEPLGAQFEDEVSLLLYHNHEKPVGTVRFHQPTKDGVPFTATLPKIAEAGVLRDRVEEAWQSVKARLLRKVSIGFRSVDGAIERLKDGGLRFLKTELLELSLVAVPANPDAAIHTIKSIDTRDRAAFGEGRTGVPQKKAGVPARVTGQTPMAKTITEQIQGFEATRQTKSSRMTEIMQKSVDDGLTLDEAQKQEYDTLKTEVKEIDEHIVRLRDLEELNKSAAKSVVGATKDEASQSRNPAPVIKVNDNLPPGLGFARMVKVKAVARLDHRYALDVAKEMYPGDARLISHFQKASVAAGTTLNAVNAAALVDPVNLASEFIEFLRPQTIIGRLNLRRVPFNIRVTGRTTGGTGYWVGEGKPKPLTAFEYNATTLGYTKVAAIAVITQELARFSTPSAEMLTRDGLRDALVERLDTDLIDPAAAAVANVQPASLTNGLTALTSAGTSADNVRTDIGSILSTFISANLDPSSIVLVMPNTLALAASLMTNGLGQPEFPGLTMTGGTLRGIPVITSQYAANASGAGNMVIAINQNEVFLADDGEVTVDASTEASLQMSDTPNNDATNGTGQSLVSMYQTNSIAFRAERFINWAKRRSTAVVYMDDVNWGSVGSPS